MASVVFGPASICAGNNHGHVTIVVDGTLNLGQVMLLRSEVMRPIEMNEVEALVNTIARIHCRNMTPAQVRSALLAGWTSTV